MIKIKKFTVNGLGYWDKSDVPKPMRDNSPDFRRFRAQVSGIEMCGKQHPKMQKMRRAELNKMKNEKVAEVRARGGKLRRSDVKIDKAAFRRRVAEDEPGMKDVREMDNISIVIRTSPAFGNKRLGALVLYDLRKVKKTPLSTHVTLTPMPVYKDLEMGTPSWITRTIAIYNRLLTTPLERKHNNSTITIEALDFPVVELLDFDWESFLPRWTKALADRGFTITTTPSQQGRITVDYITRITKDAR